MINLEDQQLIQEEKERVEKETEDLKRYEEWVDEKIRIDADIELSKMIKIEENEIPTFNVQSWIREFTAKKKKEDAATRKKKKILKGPTQLQQRREQERYLKNMKGWKLVQLKPKSDKEVFDLYQQAKRQTDTFYPMGCAEDLEYIAQMNKKLVPEKVVEVEHVKETDVLKQLDDVAEKTTSSIQSGKRKGVVHKTFAKKKRKIGEESSSKPEGDEFKNDYDHIPSEHLKEQLKVLTMIGKMEDPEVVDAVLIGIKYPIVKVST